MRQIGTLSSKHDARRFTDYLLTQGIEAEPDENGQGDWAVWVKDENKVDAAREEIEQFRADPANARYDKSSAQAQGIRKREQQRRSQAARNYVEMRGRWQKGPLQQRPFTMVLIGLCVFVALLSNFGDRWDTGLGMLTFSHVYKEGDAFVFPVDGFKQIEEGQVWRLVTPIFIHFGILHLLFNMLWLYWLGGQVEQRRGPWRLGVAILVIAAVSNSIEYLAPPAHPVFGGMSGVVYGLFGYIWIKMRVDPGSGLFVDDFTTLILLGWLVLCLTGVIGNVANWAHVVGLGMGLAVGYLSSRSR